VQVLEEYYVQTSRPGRTDKLTQEQGAAWNAVVVEQHALKVVTSYAQKA